LRFGELDLLRDFESFRVSSIGRFPSLGFSTNGNFLIPGGAGKTKSSLSACDNIFEALDLSANPGLLFTKFSESGLLTSEFD
jgi:hypothetical protein